MSNKELIEESWKRASKAISPDLFDYYSNVGKALQDAEAKLIKEENAKLEYKGLAEGRKKKINRLKADLQVIRNAHKNTTEICENLKAKLSEQVDPIEYTLWFIDGLDNFKGWDEDVAKASVEHFKKERE